jgi:hypothetical protein
MSLVHSHMARFGLDMHIGREKNGKIKASKTECVFSPPPQFFPNLNPTLEDNLINEDDVVEKGMPEERRLEVLEEARHNAKTAREDHLYDDLAETQQFTVEDGFVTFCKHFKYLGSYISYNLRDDFDIETRIAAARKSVGALSSFWNNPHVDTYSKFLIYKAIPINLLLWGCETWAPRQGLLRKLEVFLQKSMRRILGISMYQVAEDRLHNETVREKFYNISSIETTIAARQMCFIGKFVRSGFECPAKQLLTACCGSMREKGRPQMHLKDSIVKNLCRLFKNIPEVQINGKKIDQ